MGKNLILICLLFSGITYAEERTFTYFYCDYNNKDGRTVHTVFSNLLVYDGRGRGVGGIISDRKIRDIFENRPHKESTGLHLTAKSRVSCGSFSEGDKYLGNRFFYLARNHQGESYEIMSGFETKDEYLSGLKNLRIMRLKPLIEHKPHYDYERMSIERIMQISSFIR